MGKINRKTVSSKKVEVRKSKDDALTVADKGAKVSKRSGGVISLGVKKTGPMTATAKLRKKDRVKVKKQHLLLKLQGGNSIEYILTLKAKCFMCRLLTPDQESKGIFRARTEAKFFSMELLPRPTWTSRRRRRLRRSERRSRWET